jgi:hypothetical protein
MSVLPKEINYGKKNISLPKGTSCINGAVSTPATGFSFTQNQQIQFNLPSRSYLVPESIYLRYRIALTGGAADSWGLGAFPAYSVFSQCQTIIGSNVVENIANYGALNNFILTTKLNYSQKVGLACAFGVGNVTNTGAVQAYSTAFTNANCNAWDVAAASNEVKTMAIPLNCLFSNSDSLIPLKFMPACQITLTTEALTNCFAVGTTTPITGYTITNCELVYDLVDFNDEVDQAVMSMADDRGKIMIKSQSYATSGQTTNAVSSGTIEYVYAMRLASIKGLALLMPGLHASSFNKSFDSLDITSNNGSYQFNVANVQYPSRPISTVLNKNGALMELGSFFGPSHDLASSNFSITPTEWSYNNTATTTFEQPGKFYIATNTERLSTNDALLSGISSQLSSLSVRIELGTTTTNAQNLILVALYDAILEVDVANRQANLLT